MKETAPIEIASQISTPRETRPNTHLGKHQDIFNGMSFLGHVHHMCYSHSSPQSTEGPATHAFPKIKNHKSQQLHQAKTNLSVSNLRVAPGVHKQDVHQSLPHQLCLEEVYFRKGPHNILLDHLPHFSILKMLIPWRVMFL